MKWTVFGAENLLSLACTRSQLYCWQPSDKPKKSANEGGDIRIFKFAVVVLLVLVLKPPYPHSEARPLTDKQINNSVQEVSKKKPTVKAKANKRSLNKQKPSPKPSKPVTVQAPVKVQTTPEPTGNRLIGKQMALEYGWSGDQWLCLERLWSGESNWNHAAYNTSSGAGGIPQALPMSKMASFGSDYLTNPRTQIAWGLHYIKSRYGTPCSAWSFWNSQIPHWY